MDQLHFFDDLKTDNIYSMKENDKKNYIVHSFSANNICDESARMELEKRYEPILDVTTKFDRRSVSYQLSKNDRLHSWLKFKEGFSADLVNILLDEMGLKPSDLVMDPFMGSGTTALVCKMRGINSMGFDIMPISTISVNAKKLVLDYNVDELISLKNAIAGLKVPFGYIKKTPYIKITEYAYPEDNEKFIQFVTDWVNASSFSGNAKTLFTLCILNSLERCSYTWKSGQYLSWDSRSIKVQKINSARLVIGKKTFTEQHVRETIENIQTAVIEELQHVIDDIQLIQGNYKKENHASIDFRQNSVLFELPSLCNDCLNGVITSPPYCNRYDYTRTYALELVYLGLGEKEIKQMRQDLLSCTVESKPKVEALRNYYRSINALDRFEYIIKSIEENKAFQEVMKALNRRKECGDLNNNGVIRMVGGYFTELAFIYAELYRTCKKGAIVAIVNDNVRYGGEIIPVDFLSTAFAEQFGFTAKKVYCLKQRKGNSSQQMKKFGRVALRKSITIWQK